VTDLGDEAVMLGEDLLAARSEVGVVKGEGEEGVI